MSTQKRDLLVSLLLFFLLFFSYFKFQSLHIFGGDSPEFLTVAATWSIAHPPGYPFYSLLANLLRIAPIELSLIQKLNLLSIIPSVISSIFLYKIIRMFKINPFVSVLTVLFYAFLFPIWLYSEVPEVFLLNNAFISIILYLIVKIIASKNAKTIQNLVYLLAFFSSLALTHHHTIVVLFPGILYVIFKKLKSSKQIKINFFRLFLFAFLPFLFYLYAPIASSFNPPLDVENAKTLSGFIRLITRYSYGTFKAYYTSVPDIVNQLTLLFSTSLLVFQDFKPLGLLFIVLGFLFIKPKSKLFFSFLSISLIVYTIFIFISNFYIDQSFQMATFQRYLIGLYFLLSILLGFGIELFYKILITLSSSFSLSSFSKHILNIFFLILLLFFVGNNFYFNLQTMKNLPQLRDFENHLNNLTLTLPKDKKVVLILKSDLSSFPFYYFYYVLSKDLSDSNRIIKLAPGLLNRKYYIDRLKNNHPVLQGLKEKEFTTQNLIKYFAKKGYFILSETPYDIESWLPYGFLWTYVSNKSNDKILNESLQLWELYSFPKINSQTKRIFFLISLRDYYVKRAEMILKFLKAKNVKKEYIQAFSYIVARLNL